jgi:hypothetical protein
MPTILRLLAVFAILTGVCAAQSLRELPETPQRVVDAKFISYASISAASTFADSYTTLWATQNWRAGKTNVCNMEVQSPYLYGVHPTPGRVYAVAAGKSATAILASYYMRKHHSRFWTVPMFVNSAFSLQGVGQNMATCN